ncbi:alpha/beta hydrolase (plasmid) [Embleya sp. NBC_00888]|uniref:alpha/beta fold hydrolase n=1 Tax=Embleya sp. NBC_00888 TaxID=2975960 RepID=UPI00386BE4A0|nr:alpha/beta hydrolase [Embleya sp. NBC_00888]
MAPLTEGVHTLALEGGTLRYHVHGSGPVCVAHPGGPGFDWQYLRAPALEERLTVVYVEPLGTGGAGRLASHPHGYTRARYSRHLAALIDHLGVGRVHLLGHSHGGFVTQYHALHRPDQLAGIVLYASSPTTGPDFGAEIAARVGEFASRHVDAPELAPVLDAFAGVGAIASDADMLAAAKGVLPAYIAGYWDDVERWAPFRDGLRATYISGLDEHGAPDVVDDHAALAGLTAPALVITGRFDVVCGVRWAEDLHNLIPVSRLLVLERSGHFGHLEEPGLFAGEVCAFVTVGEGR